MSNNNKLKLALYWAATCGGCDVAILDIEEKILDLLAIADIVFWPVATDFKYKDVEAMAPNSIDICLFNGSIRNSEHEEIAKLLRAKSKIMIAFGSCACFGGIPGLANVANREQIFKVVYDETITTVNPDKLVPATELVIEPAGGSGSSSGGSDATSTNRTLTLPEFYDTVKALNQIIDVDYYIPGCPPAVERIQDALEIIKKFVATGELPPKGTVVAFTKSVCDECKREREGKSLMRIYRPHELTTVDTNKCLLDQGILCIGPATRGGCGTRCINVNMPCRGCMGPLPEVDDQGAAILSAIASVLGLEREQEMSAEERKQLVDQIKDPLGTFYRFSLPTSLLKRAVIK